MSNKLGPRSTGLAEQQPDEDHTVKEQTQQLRQQRRRSDEIRKN